MKSPTQKSLSFLREIGFKVAVTERWNGPAKKRQDLFGFADIVALSRLLGVTIGVQTTSLSNFSSRMEKTLDVETARDWLAVGNLILIQGWKLNRSRRLEARNALIVQRTREADVVVYDGRFLKIDGEAFLQWMKGILG